MGSRFFKDRDFNRRHERKKYGASVVFTYKDRAYTGTLSDISVGGAFIETPSANLFSIGDAITVSIPFTTGKKHVKRSATIIRTNDAGFAVEFN